MSNCVLDGLKLKLTPGSEPTAQEGTIYYDSTAKKVKYYDGTSWVTTGGGGGEGICDNWQERLGTDMDASLMVNAFQNYTGTKKIFVAGGGEYSNIFSDSNWTETYGSSGPGSFSHSAGTSAGNSESSVSASSSVYNDYTSAITGWNSYVWNGDVKNYGTGNPIYINISRLVVSASNGSSSMSFRDESGAGHTLASISVGDSGPQSSETYEHQLVCNRISGQVQWLKGGVSQGYATLNPEQRWFFSISTGSGPVTYRTNYRPGSGSISMTNVWIECAGNSARTGTLAFNSYTFAQNCDKGTILAAVGEGIYSSSDYTTLGYNMSLNNGTDWAAVDVGQIKDLVNGADAKIKVNVSTKDGKLVGFTKILMGVKYA